MKEIAKRPKILIVSGYHPKETFAVNVGEYLLQNSSTPDIKVVRYTGEPDRKTSTYNLRKFVEKFDPVISPIILHSDDDIGVNAVIIYSAKSKKGSRRALKPLIDFGVRHSNNGDNVVVYGRFLTYNTNYGLIDIELNPRIGLEKAKNLVESFSRYLIDLYLEKGIKL